MKYQTKQKSIILNYLKENENCLYSAKQLQQIFKDEVSKATLYRYLDELYNENIINRYFNEQTNNYEYLYVASKLDCQHHLHFKCSKCGKLYHLKNAITNEQFLIDFSHSLICGLCVSCQIIH